MINRLIELSLRNRFIVIALFIALAGWGWWAVKATPIDAIPDLSDNQVIVFTDWPGHSPQEVEDQVTYPLTVNLQGLAGVRVVRSQSAFGFSMIYVVFEDDVDLYFARARVLERMSLVAKALPAGVVPDAWARRHGRRPRLLVHARKPDPSRSAISAACRTGSSATSSTPCPASPKSRRSAASSSSTRSTSIPTAFVSTRLPLSAVVSAVRESNLNVGGNVLESNGAWLIVRGVGLIASVEDLKTDRDRRVERDAGLRRAGRRRADRRRVSRGVAGQGNEGSGRRRRGGAHRREHQGGHRCREGADRADSARASRRASRSCRSTTARR